MIVALAYRLDPRAILAIAEDDPALYATMLDVAEGAVS